MKWDFLRNFWRGGEGESDGSNGSGGSSGRGGNGGRCEPHGQVVGGVGLYCFDGFFKGDAMGDAAT